MGGSTINHRRFTSTSTSTLLLLSLCLITGCFGNLPPFFKDDMNNHVIPENTPVGSVVYTLKGVDPENAPLKYGIMGTDKLKVDETTGVVTVVKPIDRETEDRLKLTVTVEDGISSNVVTIPVSVTISDHNDNAPIFQNPGVYENVEVIEDTKLNSKILGITIKDPDLSGMTLSVKCVPSSQSPEACSIFLVKIHEASAGHLVGDLVLGESLDFNKRSMYQFQLVASDGEHKSSVGVLIRIKDVQNKAPIFTGAMAGRVMEDAQVGTLVMLIQARDGDLGKPRDVKLTLDTNPGEVFQLDSETGRLTTTRPLDRETLGSLLKLEVNATEVTSKREGEADIVTTIRNVTVLIDDVNDSEPTFNRKQYSTEIPENSLLGTPLPDLDMSITDPDTGTFADFTLRIEGPLADLFDIQPKFASGSVKPVIRVKKSFDHENPNERKFILLVIAQNTDEPEPFSSATVTVSTIDENDNRPKFDRDVYQLRIPEDTKVGTKIGEITAEDPDSGEFGNEGLVYQLIGTGSKRFYVNNRTGEIFVAPCSSNCLDYENQKTYDLLYMGSDTHKQEGFIKSVVPVQIILTDSNDNPVYFEEENKDDKELSAESRELSDEENQDGRESANKRTSRTIPENSLQFEPPFFITAKDRDDSSVITYRLLSPKNSSVNRFFKVDENTGEILIKSNNNPSRLIPPANYSFKIEASDGNHTAVTSAFVEVTDINNHHPAFAQDTLENRRNLNVQEDVKVGSIITTITAKDEDLGENGVVRYSIDKGSLGYFEIDPEKGDITLIKELDNDEVSNFELLVTAYDQGTPSLRTSITLQINVLDVYLPLPKMSPEVQRVQVSESTEVGDLVTTLTLKESVPSEDHEGLLRFQFLDIEARNPDNKRTEPSIAQMAKDWFRIDNEGKVEVASVLQRELVTAINLTVLITSEKARPGSKSLGSLMITVFEVNDKPPVVEDMEIEILEELPPGQAILTLEAEDPEGGQISNYFIQEGSEYFSIDNKTGEIKVAGRLDSESQPMYNITVVAVDSGVPQLSSTATILVSLINDNDNDPTFEKNEYEAKIEEHPASGTIVTRVTATDPDVDSSITYELVDGGDYSGAFEIDRLGQILVTKEGRELIDREKMDHLPYVTLNIKASDGERFGFTTVRILVLDKNDNPPTFPQGKHRITVHAPLRTKQEIIRVPADGNDLPETDRLRYRIVDGNGEGIFEIDGATGIIRAAQPHDKSGEMKLTIQVTDEGEGGFLQNENNEGHTANTSVLIQILPGNFRRPEFMFPNKINSTLIAMESDLKEIEKFSSSEYSKVLGQLLAFDPDEGEAGKIQFFFKEGDSLVTDTELFRIETDTGKIHQIRPLDREKMNKYDILVVAKDGGIPVSTQSQHILTIQVQDIDDHKPHFKDRQYSFLIRENSPENTFIGQVHAQDEDEGNNAQIFYFLVTSKDHAHIKEDLRVDMKTGMIHSNRILDRERIDAYTVYVRASASPIIPRTLEVLTSPGDFHTDFSLAVVNISVLDENDNAPRFGEKQYYAAINSDAEPGREILTLRAIDIDTKESSPVQYSLLASNLILDDGTNNNNNGNFRSGGSVIPSPFRIDQHTGRLTLSQTAMRQYTGGSSRFQVKVSVRETVPPYHSDTTHVQVWVVESSQESVLTVKSPPASISLTKSKDELIHILSNITGTHVLITKIIPHVKEDFSVNKEWSDIYVTSIDRSNLHPVGVPQFLQALDLGHDYLKNAEAMPIILHSAVPATPAQEGEEGEYGGVGGFDAAFAGLIALVALLCMGLAAIIACCCCLNRLYEKDNDSEKQTIYGGHMKYPLHASHPSIPGTPSIGVNRRPQQPGPGDMIEDIGTDNPLWIDHKITSYEEQELSMQVADNSNSSADLEDDEDDEEEEVEGLNRPHQGHGNINNRTNNNSNNTRQQRGVSGSPPPFSHAYATLHRNPEHAEDYDNIHILGDDTIAVHL